MGFGAAETAYAGWRYAYPAYKTDTVRVCKIVGWGSVLLKRHVPDGAALIRPTNDERGLELLERRRPDKA